MSDHTDRGEQFFIVHTGFKCETVDDLIFALQKFRAAHGNLPVYHENDCMHEEIEFFSITPATEDDDSLNAGLPKRLVIS